MRCEDYPCCGHTDGLGCDWTYTTKARAHDIEHANCDHENGICETFHDEWGDEPHVYDYDLADAFGIPWCYGCDDYATRCPER